MDIDLTIEAMTTKKNYLRHEHCSAAGIAKLVDEGKSASDIARTLGVSRFIVGRVLTALETTVSPTRIDYLRHPLCKIEVALDLRQKGVTYEEIGIHLGVSHQLVRNVLRAWSASTGLPIPPARDKRLRSVDRRRE